VVQRERENCIRNNVQNRLSYDFITVGILSVYHSHLAY